jgi:phosphoribosylformylglycinamidine synthase
MKAALVIFPGSNRERDMRLALEQATGAPPVTVWHRDADFPKVDLIVIPGGFSYGDYLRAGAMAAHSPVMREIVKRAGAGVHVLGVCNGFQVLTECQLLPGALMRNAGLKFICRDVHLRIEATDNVFLGSYREGQVISVPVAHMDGNYFADPRTLDMLEGEGRVAVRYCDERGELSEAANPNGSINSIAGIVNEKRNVLGMMPHPEDSIDARFGGTDGIALFAGLTDALAKIPA